MKDKEPCTAARMFAIDVRADNGTSGNSAAYLTEIQSPCATWELIQLLGLNDGRYVRDGCRQVIF
jgi:hypothetical protein